MDVEKWRLVEESGGFGARNGTKISATFCRARGNIESELKSFVKITAPVKYLLKTVNLLRDKFDVENGTKILPVSADGKSLIKLKLTIVLVQE